MKFCFWGDITNTLLGNTIGGGELQVSLLAKALARDGHDVIIIDPYQQESFVTKEGIQIFHVPNWNKGWRGFRLFWYRIPALFKLFMSHPADCYYVRMKVYLHIFPYLAAKKFKAKFLLGLASDSDVFGIRDSFRFIYKSNFRITKYLFLWLPNDLMFKFLLKRADYVISQHAGQQITWGGVRGKKVIFPNIIDYKDVPSADINKKDYFVYVGSLTIKKGADHLYNLINSLPENVEVVIAGQPNDVKAVPFFEQLEKIRNCDVLGRVNHDEALKLIANARALINTSNFEGFPNVFLEAWAVGVPVLSLNVNPANVFNKYKLGFCFNGDLQKMKQAMVNQETDGICREDFISYLRQFHDFNTAAQRFISMMHS